MPERQLSVRFTAVPYTQRDPAAARLIGYHPLPRCEISEVQLQEIRHHTSGSEFYDVLYFNETDEKQAANAADYRKKAVAYRAALIDEPKKGGPDQWQVLARMVQIPCLPARFHFAYIGGKRYVSIRTGEHAWKE